MYVNIALAEIQLRCYDNSNIVINITLVSDFF